MKKIIAFISLILIFSLSTTNILAADTPTNELPPAGDTPTNELPPAGDTPTNELPKYQDDEKRIIEARKKIISLEQKKIIKQKFISDKKVLQEKRKITLTENRTQIKLNREKYRTENKGKTKEVLKSLSEETRTEIRDSRKDFTDQVSELKEKYKGLDKNADNLAQYREELAETRKAFYLKIEGISGESTEAKELLEKRKKLFLQNQELRDQNTKARIEYRGERNDLVVKYKTAFIKRLENRLDKVPTNKLDKVSEKIDTLIEKTEARTNMSDKNKDTLISQLLALKELLDEKVEDIDNESVDLDILEILEV